MCIRDSHQAARGFTCGIKIEVFLDGIEQKVVNGALSFKACLLYTSDAADERSSVDLGGRRIIKKKNTEEELMWRSTHLLVRQKNSHIEIHPRQTNKKTG